MPMQIVNAVFEPGTDIYLYRSLARYIENTYVENAAAVKVELVDCPWRKFRRENVKVSNGGRPVRPRKDGPGVGWISPRHRPRDGPRTYSEAGPAGGDGLRGPVRDCDGRVMAPVSRGLTRGVSQRGSGGAWRPPGVPNLGRSKMGDRGLEPPTSAM